MRSALSRLAILALAAASAASCDSRSLTESGSAGSVGIEIPRVAASGAIAAQVNTTVGRVGVRITEVGTGRVVLQRDYQFSDIRDRTETGPVVGTLVVTFPLPSDGGMGALEVVVEIYNSDGLLLFRMGPAQFTLGSGASATVEVPATYVGPGSQVTGVRLEPRTLVLVQGESAPVSCVGTPGDVTLFPFFLETGNVAVATVTGTAVTGVAAGATHVRCQLEFGTASDQVPVTVIARPTSLTVLSGGGQSGAAGAPLAQPIRFEVRGANNLPVAGVVVQIAVTTGDGQVSPTQVTSAADGTGQVSWTLGSLVGTQTIQITVPGTNLTQTVSATATQSGGTISGLARNAQTANTMSGVTVELRLGSGVTTGTPLASTTSNSGGQFTFTGLAAGTYTLRAVAAGFAQAIQNVVAPASGQVSVILSLSPVLSAGQVRIVLSWGPTPPDLDAHLAVPGVGVVYYLNPGTTGAPFFASLDADQTTGFGPETITIHQLLSGTYTFMVHDFTNFSGATTALSQSNARVDVYVGAAQSASFTFTPPQQAGVLWTVFNLTAGTGGSVSVTPVGTISTVGPSGLRAGLRGGDAALLKQLSFGLR